MSIIGKKNQNMGRLFSSDVNIFVNLCEQEKCEKFGQFSGTNILEVISFNFDV